MAQAKDSSFKLVSVIRGTCTICLKPVISRRSGFRDRTTEAGYIHFLCAWRQKAK